MVSPEFSLVFFLFWIEKEIFIWNLNDREVNELESLLPLLDPIHLSNALDTRTWTLDSSGGFFCKSYFQFSASSPNIERFLLNPYGNLNLPLRSKAFVWTVVLNQINTKDIL